MLNVKRIPLYITILLTSYFIAVMHIYIPNMGGVGLKLPSNIICWSIVSLIVMLSGYTLRYARPVTDSLPLKLFVIGGGLLTIPAFYFGHVVPLAAIQRVAGLWGGIALFWALQQVRFTSRQRNVLIFSLMMGALIEWGITLWQLKTHNYDNWMEFAPQTRPYGIFQQINVLASFLATGYAVAARFTVMPVGRWGNLLSRAAVVGFASLLVILQSRIGYLGAITVFTVFFVAYYRRTPNVWTLLILSVGGIIIGEILVHSHWLSPMVENVQKEGSNSERLFIFQATVEMIRQHPLVGWGYGHFESAIAPVSALVFHHRFAQPITHAHNEFLFGWAEGGIVAAAGMLVFAVGYLLLLRKNVRSVLPTWILTLPIALHLMTEYPLYQSAAHWLTLILLCRLCVSDKVAVPLPTPTPTQSGKSLSAFVVVIFGCVLLFMISGLKTAQTLTQFERQGMRDFSAAEQLPNPWIQWERYNYDRHIALLLVYNQTHDETLLNNFMKWGVDYISVHNDINVYKYLIAISHYQGNSQLEAQLKVKMGLVMESKPF